MTLQDWALIRRLYFGERLPKVEIAIQLGISRIAVAKAGRLILVERAERPTVVARDCFDLADLVHPRLPERGAQWTGRSPSRAGSVRQRS